MQLDVLFGNPSRRKSMAKKKGAAKRGKKKNPMAIYENAQKKRVIGKVDYISPKSAAAAEKKLKAKRKNDLKAISQDNKIMRRIKKAAKVSGKEFMKERKEMKKKGFGRVAGFVRKHNVKTEDKVKALLAGSSAPVKPAKNLAQAKLKAKLMKKHGAVITAKRVLAEKAPRMLAKEKPYAEAPAPKKVTMKKKNKKKVSLKKKVAKKASTKKATKKKASKKKSSRKSKKRSLKKNPIVAINPVKKAKKVKAKSKKAKKSSKRKAKKVVAKKAAKVAAPKKKSGKKKTSKRKGKKSKASKKSKRAVKSMMPDLLAPKAKKKVKMKKKGKKVSMKKKHAKKHKVKSNPFGGKMKDMSKLVKENLALEMAELGGLLGGGAAITAIAVARAKFFPTLHTTLEKVPGIGTLLSKNIDTIIPLAVGVLVNKYVKNDTAKEAAKGLIGASVVNIGASVALAASKMAGLPAPMAGIVATPAHMNGIVAIPSMGAPRLSTGDFGAIKVKHSDEVGSGISPADFGGYGISSGDFDSQGARQMGGVEYDYSNEF